MANRVLLIGGNFSPELTGIGKYNGEMMEWLSNNEFECTVITTFPYYPQWKVEEPYKKKSFWYLTEEKPGKNLTKIVRCPHYVPENPSGAKRLLSDFSVFISIGFVLFSFLFKRRFDYIITVAPPFTLGFLGILYKKIRKTKVIYHIQDLQIDAARDLKMINSKGIIKTLFALEKFILNHVDIVTTISKGMMKKVTEKCPREVKFFPNWVDENEFYPIASKDALKVKFGFEASDTIILYSGAIGEKQGLELIIHSAKYFEGDQNIKFIICGSGPYKKKLEELCEGLGITNVYFKPLQPFQFFNQFLNMADVHLILQKANASDLVLPSKLSAILATGGVVIVSADENTSLFEIIHLNKIGFIIKPENQDALNDAIENAVNAPTNELSARCRTYAENNLSINSILKSFVGMALTSKNNSTPVKKNIVRNFNVLKAAE